MPNLESTDVMWEALRAFLHRPWFTRLWVIQEVVSTLSVDIICGSWTVSLYHFILLIGQCERLSM
jgi:hypothetical protein